MKNPKEPIYTEKLLELVKEFSKFAVYKINTQKPVGFLYTGQSEDNFK